MPLSSLRRLRRYQDIFLLGGGVVVTLIGLIAVFAVCAYAIRQFIAVEKQQLTDDGNRVVSVVKEAETSLRRTLSIVELLWPTLQGAGQTDFDSFVDRGYRLTIEPPLSSGGVLFVADASALHNQQLVRRYLALAQRFVFSNAVASISNNMSSEGYIFSPDNELIVVPASVVPEYGPIDVAALIRKMRVDFNELGPHKAEQADRTLHPVYWLSSVTNPLTGRERLRLVSQAVSNGVPFAVVAIEYDPQMLLKELGSPDSGHVYEIIGADSKVMATFGVDVDKHLATQAWLSHQQMAPKFFGRDVGYSNGFFVMTKPIADTGWKLLSTFSWRDVAAGIAAQVITVAVAIALILGAVWTLLMMFRSRIFAPLLADSARVFESENLSRQVIQTVPVGLALVWRSNGEWLLGNPLMHDIASRIVGREKVIADELVSRYADFERDHLQDAQAGVLRQDFVFSAADGEQLEFAGSASQARFKGDDVLVAAFIDVTEGRRMQRELGEAMRAADSANQAKSAFLAAISHEIRTPLNAILGNLELLATSSLTGAQRDRLSTVRAASNGLLAVISDVLDFSKIEAGEMGLEYIEFDILEVVERVLKIFEPVARARGISLYAKWEMATSQTMWGDSTRVAQILNNLLSNAIKFTERGSVTVEVAVEHAKPDSPQLTFTVADTGIGIADEQRERLFRAFSQLDVSINRRFGGTGLGLALCQHIVHAMNGRIDVSSTLNVGSRFTVSLPTGAGIAIRTDARMLTGQRVLFLSSADEWCTFAVPHLENWGARVQVFRHPAAITERELEDDALLVIWGTREQWHADDENRLVEEAAWLIDGYSDGPAQAIRSGKVVSVSCLSLKGLQAGVRAMLLNEALPAPSDTAVSWARPEGVLPERRPQVLIAEDNAANRLLLSEQLVSLGCRVTAAASGKQTLKVFGNEDWDVLLTDLNMPGMSGYQLAEVVRRLRPTLPIIAITAHATKEERQRCEEAGMVRVMTKPISLRQLNDAIASIAVVKGVRRSGLSTVDEGAIFGDAMPKHLRETFIKSIDDALTAINAAESARNVDALLEELHSLRGALAVFGHEALAASCGSIEQKIKLDRSAELPDELDDLKRSLGLLLDAPA